MNNAPTVANEIPNQTATERSAFSYAFPDNTFSDTDSGDTLTYTATKGDGTALPIWLTFTASSRTFAGTPRASDAGTLMVKVTASDGTDTVSDTFNIVVSALPVVRIAGGEAVISRARRPTFTLTVTPIADQQHHGERHGRRYRHIQPARSAPTQDSGMDEPDETVEVGGTADLPVTQCSTQVTIIDATPQVTLALSSTSIGENGGVSTITATLDRASSAETTVTVAASAVTPAVAEDYALSGNKILTIAAGTMTSTGAVTLTGVNNDVDAEDKTVTVSATAVNSQGATVPANVTLTITDDDTAGVTVSKSTLVIAEGGSGSYTVVLDTQPSADVTIALSSDNTDVTLSTQPLTFTSSDWNSAQTVTVSAAQDADAVADSATITHMVSGGGYDSVSANSVAVTVTDTTSTRVTLSVDPATVGEGAGTTKVTVTATLNGAGHGVRTLRSR